MHSKITKAAVKSPLVHAQEALHPKGIPPLDRLEKTITTPAHTPLGRRAFHILWPDFNTRQQRRREQRATHMVREGARYDGS